MKKLITCMLLILSASSAYSKTLDEKPDEFLQSMAPRFPTWGTFGELVGNLKGAGLANIELKSSKAGKQKFESSPGSDTKLKYCEYFEALARYTGTNCRYAEKEKTWIFDEPEMPLPFTIKLAPGWRMENRGQYCA